MEADLAQERQEVHCLIDALPEEKLKTAKTLLKVLVEPSSFAESLESAPYEDEELLPQFAESLQSAYACAETGNVTSHEEMLREFRG